MKKYMKITYLFSVDDERYYLVQEINREPLSEFTMENRGVPQASPVSCFCRNHGISAL